jgi:hypothetical protein
MSSTEIVAMRPPLWRPRSVLLSSAQDMKGFPITLASNKKRVCRWQHHRKA